MLDVARRRGRSYIGGGSYRGGDGRFDGGSGFARDIGFMAKRPLSALNFGV
jgi:hypothetical protein